MPTLRMLATHEVVQRLHPREVTEQDQWGMIAGRVIDTTLSQASHEVRIGRKPTATSLLAAAGAQYDELLAETDLDPDPARRTATLEEVGAVLKAFRASPLYGLPRPRTRWIRINDEVGMYAQPDFWDPRGTFYEMKSYRPVPVPADVATQLRCFQLAYPNARGILIGFDRRARPVGTTAVAVEPTPPAEREHLLRRILDIGREVGLPKVEEYLAPPSAQYRIGPT